MARVCVLGGVTHPGVSPAPCPCPSARGVFIQCPLGVPCAATPLSLLRLGWGTRAGTPSWVLGVSPGLGTPQGEEVGREGVSWDQSQSGGTAPFPRGHPSENPGDSAGPAGHLEVTPATPILLSSKSLWRSRIHTQELLPQLQPPQTRLRATTPQSGGLGTSLTAVIGWGARGDHRDAPRHPLGLTPSLLTEGSCGWTWSCGTWPSISAPAGRAGSRTRIAVTPTAPRYPHPAPKHPRTPCPASLPPASALSSLPGRSICFAQLLSHRSQRFIVQILPRHRRVTRLLAARCAPGFGSIAPGPSSAARASSGLGTNPAAPQILRGGSHPELSPSRGRRWQLLVASRLCSGHPSRKQQWAWVRGRMRPAGIRERGPGRGCRHGWAGLGRSAALGVHLGFREGFGAKLWDLILKCLTTDSSRLCWCGVR